MFLIDICQIFNSAYYDENFNMVVDRKLLAKTYIGSWFIVDVVAIIPFDLFMGNSNSINEIVRITRIGRMYKLVKLTRMFKVFKFMKEKNKMFISVENAKNALGTISVIQLQRNHKSDFFI